MQRNAHVHGLCPSLRIRTIDKGDSRLLSAGMEIDDWKYEVSNTDLKSNAHILSFDAFTLSFQFSVPLLHSVITLLFCIRWISSFEV